MLIGMRLLGVPVGARSTRLTAEEPGSWTSFVVRRFPLG